MDNAGNLGPATSPFTFSVDASLPVNGTATVMYSDSAAGASSTNVLVVGIVAGVAALLVALIVIGAFLLRRHSNRRGFRATMLPEPRPSLLLMPRSGQALQADLQASSSEERLREWEQERVRLAIQVSEGWKNHFLPLSVR